MSRYRTYESRGITKTLRGQRESRVQNADPSGREKRFNAKGLEEALKGFGLFGKVRSPV